MSKKVFIVHGFQDTPQSGWIPWLKAKLEEDGSDVNAITMPNPHNPVCDEWVKTLSETVADCDENVFLVGHSLGVPTILHFLESLNDGEKIGGIVLVSGFYKPVLEDDDPEERKIDHFVEHEFDWEKIRNSCEKCIVIHGDDDDSVPVYHGEYISKMLGCELVTIKNGGHLNGESNWFELPEALEWIREHLCNAKK